MKSPFEVFALCTSSFRRAAPVAGLTLSFAMSAMFPASAAPEGTERGLRVAPQHEEKM